MTFLLSLIACWLVFRVLDGLFGRRAERIDLTPMRETLADLNERALELEALARRLQTGPNDDPGRPALRVVNGGRG